MSRIGNKAISIPAGVTVTVADGNKVTVKGPKGELTASFNSDLEIKVEASQAEVKRPNDTKVMKALHGTTRALLHNMIVGVSEGFVKKIEIVGVGYRAALNGKTLTLSAGYSHPVSHPSPCDIQTFHDKRTLLLTCQLQSVSLPLTS